MKPEDLKAFKNQCAGKMAHPTISGAEYVLSTMRVNPNEILEIYKCKFCSAYHIGHKPGTKHLFKKRDKPRKKIKRKPLTED